MDIVRSINCLKSDDRLIRKKALLNIKNEKGISFDVFSSLLRPLLNVISDPSDTIREMSVCLLVDNVQLITPEQLLEIIPVIERQLPEENCEEIRLQMANLMDSFLPNSLSINIIMILLKDPFPPVRHVACHTMENITNTTPQLIYENGKLILDCLIPSLTHNHSKLRKAVVSTIGSVTMHVKGDIVKEVIPHLTQRLFDSNQSVRESVTRVVGNWLLHLPDRYSYFHNLIPLILTSLSDPNIASLTQSLWNDIGIKFITENEDDLKDKINYLYNSYDVTIANTTYYSLNMGCCELVQRNLGRILPPLLSDLSDWISSTRIKAAELLPILLLNSQEHITQHVEMLVNVIIKMGCDDEDVVKTKAVEAAQIMGYFVKSELWFNVITSHLSKNTSSSLLLQSTLSAITGIVKGSSLDDLSPIVNRLLNSFTVNEISQTEHKSTHLVLVECLDCIVSLVGEKVDLFEVLSHSLYVLSMSLDEQIGINVRKLWENMTKLDGVLTPSQLIDKYSTNLIQSLDSNSQWTDQSPQGRFFETILTESSSFSTWRIGMPYLEVNLTPNNDASVRLRLLSLISRELPRVLGSNVEIDDVVRITESLIMPNIVWKAGRSASAVRTAGLACLWSLFNTVFCRISGLFPIKLCCDLLNLLSCCLDDHSCNSRLFSIKICDKIMNLFANSNINCEEFDLFTFYDNLLKRLDDTEDSIRIAVIDASFGFFECLRRCGGCNESHFEMFYRRLILHMDDPEPLIQQSVCELLMNVSDINGHVMKSELDKVSRRHRVNQYCDKLNNILEFS